MIKSIVICFVFCPFLCWGQKEELPEPTGSFSAIIVEDMARSKTWYQEVLGFEILSETENKERRIHIVNLKRSQIQLELISLFGTVPAKKVQAELQGNRISGFFKFGFRVDQFNLWVEHIKKFDAEAVGDVVKDPVSGKLMVLIKDPDGNRIQLFQQ